MTDARPESGLLAPVFDRLPLGQIKPAGWLSRQLRIQAEGLSGHLDEFWPDIRDSGWIGGTAEGWERGPYWLDGFIPLAFLLEDERLQAKARRWMDYILTHQHADGWLGPVQDAKRGYAAHDPWPVFVVLKAMTQYEEVTGDPRVVPVMVKFLRNLDALLDASPLDCWGKSRWSDLVLSIHWLYERQLEPWLLKLASKVQSQGYDWRAHFETFRYTTRFDKNVQKKGQETHVVNSAMAVKAPGVWYRQSRDPGDRDAVQRILDQLDTFHGQATGLFSGDEHYAGKNPSQGTELCAVVEMMFALETLAGILGAGELADRLERIAFNALPAAFTPDMWAHQYDQQANQVLCRVPQDMDTIFTTNGVDANTFGLEPHFGCCTANLHQGWPKFTEHLWMKQREAGLAAIAYAPCRVDTQLQGVPVGVEVVTDYPFDDLIEIHISPERPLAFPLSLRIPGWTMGAELQIDDEAPQPVPAGGFHRVTRTWHRNTVRLRLPMPLRVERRFHNSATIHRGPLVYSLKIGERWQPFVMRKDFSLITDKVPDVPYASREVHPTTPWNYALRMDPRDPSGSIRFEKRPVGACPFSPEGAPVLARVEGRRVPGWTLEHNAAGVLPVSPVESSEVLEALTLIPYGCTNLRVTEFPVLA